MIDTTQEIKNLQLKIWLDKSPMERLRQFMTDNEALIKFWKEVKPDENVIIKNNVTKRNN